MILGLGTDLVDITRIERSLTRFGDQFARRVFTAQECAASDARAQRAASYAKRFAAKEAGVKALGTGFRGGITWQDLEVINAANGRPSLRLTGEAAALLARITPPGMIAILHLSLTDEPPMAQATVIIEARPLFHDAKGEPLAGQD